ncbi:hypothetical protein FXE09_07940 [Aggregatibacter actinomycetemcomitans]|uniref:hypothetical protein n=1 Tax=Aggregatibacter actinomycetemcomitans TaxID=714 RepID=UPI0011D5CD14|nr:hypothetical protein [Aggregatibacter actinomycetemcomitans]TYA87714.1 hypothetical protein FXE09_07940 [Aggregatibacter actinomycetemcomitans]
MNELTIKIVMLLLPGIIITMLIDKFTEHKEWNNYKYSLFVISYGILSYLILQILSLLNQCAKIGYENFTLNNAEYLQVWDVNSSINLPYNEVIASGIVSFFLGLLFIYIDHKEYLAKFLLKFNISRKYGDYGVFPQLLKDNKDQYIDITIWDKNLFIRGIVNSFHEDKELFEIYIENADVYKTSKGKATKIYTALRLSICELYKNLIISTTQQPSKGE